jgi:TrmH family RNA methyltransferase
VAASSDFERLIVVLVSPRNPLNVGAAARAMSNFGFSRLRVVNPYEVAFREARSAVGASSVLHRAEEYGSLADAIADCTLVVGTTAARKRELHHTLRSLPDGARLIRSRLKSSRVALLFGSEKRGLSNDDFSHCHWLMRIPTREEHGSMNLGQAVAVCLYEIARSASAKRADKIQLATAAEVEAVTNRLFEALTLSGYVKPHSAASTEEKIRRMVRRLAIPASDADVWMGILRQILWKLRSGSFYSLSKLHWKTRQ